ncbi:hypothetical protein [Pseudoramibacter porci]|uniref:Uncharacterized protein n=1 Tax=Pseudoramibacter porci TaxID=2606631 RepID=A0A7X2T9X9_9FIRM|nr:hypothetical protein [Pseudoramibacter porci]MSS19268.1 hypothetical protein [Pseudoramibacter porci]
MKAIFKQADLQAIADAMVDVLRGYENGSRTTTARLAHQLGYTDLTLFDLLDVHNALLRAAQENHMELDFSEHDGKVEGWPFNLDFIVKHHKR